MTAAPSTGAAPATPMRVAMLVRSWPKLSETFILEEVLALERQGADLRLYAMTAPTDEVTHGAVSRVRSPLVRVPSRAGLGDSLARHAGMALARPAAYVRAAAYVLAGGLRDGRRRWRDFVRAGWLASQLRRDGVQHLHVHFISDTADVGRAAAAMAGLRFSISAHAKDIYLSDPADLHRKLTAAAFTVTCTDANRRALTSIAPHAPVHLMYHGIDRDVFDPARRTPMSPGEAPLILAVGRLREKKGLDTLIDACAHLHARGRHVRCDIVGYGEAHDALAHRIEAAGLGRRVRLVGKLTREQVIERYARAAVFVQPSRIAADGDRDGIPNVLLEAMAMTLPVVASSVSGIPELVDDGVNGLLVEPDRPQALADAIERVLDDPRLAAALGRAGRQKVTEGFDNDRNLIQLSALLGRVHAGEGHDAESARNPWVAAGPRAPTRVAYVMNGFPRLSETFIAHEIHQLERLGLSMRLYAVKNEREPMVHPVVASIRAPLVFLPEVTSLSGTTLPAWLRRNAGAYGRAHAALLVRRPLAWLSTLGTALALAWRHRPRETGRRFALRKVFVKEFVQAGWIAHAVRTEGDVSHLHGHFCHGVATITWFASRMSGLPFSFTAHAKDIYQAELNPGRLLERKLGAARFVATCTCANAQVLRARHARPGEVHAIYHGLDTEWFSPRRSTSSAATSDVDSRVPVLLAVGRLVEKKGFDRLVEACALLRDRGLAFTCRIVGEEGSAGAQLRAHVARLDLAGCVAFTGPMSQDRLREVYREARVFALPCRVMDDGDRDGFPNVLAEAMAMGVPVVTTPVSGIPEMIDHGVHGLLVDGTPAELADAIARLLTDDALHAQLAASARQRICERFDSRRTTVALHELFVRPAARSQGSAAATGAIQQVGA